jgi:hypothetical protein
LRTCPAQWRPSEDDDDCSCKVAICSNFNANYICATSLISYLLGFDFRTDAAKMSHCSIMQRETRVYFYRLRTGILFILNGASCFPAYISCQHLHRSPSRNILSSCQRGSKIQRKMRGLQLYFRPSFQSLTSFSVLSSGGISSTK